MSELQRFKAEGFLRSGEGLEGGRAGLEGKVSSAQPGFVREENAFAKYFDILLRKKRMILVTCLLVLAATAAFSWAVTPKYEGLTQVELQPASASSAEANQLLSMLVDPTLALQTQIELMKSNAVVEPAAKKLGLKDPVDLKDAMSVSLVNGTQIVEIRVRHEDPAKARNWAEAIADEYLAFRRKRASDVSFSASEALERRIGAAKTGLDQITRQLQQNPAAGADLNPQREALLDQLTGLQAQLLAQLTALETQLSQLPGPDELSRGSGVKIGSETPEDPVVPNLPLNFGLAVLIGALLAAALAFGSEAWSGYQSSRKGVQKQETPAVLAGS